MQVFGQDINFEIENKKKAGAYLAVMALCMGFTVVNFVGKATSPASTPTPTPAKAPVQAAQQAPQAKESGNGILIENSKIDLGMLSQRNPFVPIDEVEPLENSTLAKSNATRAAAVAAREESMSHEVTYGPTGNIPLPDIPSAGKPLSMTIPPTLSGSPSASTPSASTGGNQAAVKGIMSDMDGNSMAIMSDGQIIDAGDAYGGSTVTEVSNSGVVLENGTVMAYK